MRKLNVALIAGLLCVPVACKDYLDVNTNPNAPQSVAPNLYLAPMIHWFATSPQLDGRFIGHFTQEWYSTSTSASPAGTWGKMGYDPASDNGAQQWRDVYWSFGQNLVDMMAKAEAEQRWDVLGIGYILKGWGWQVLTDTHGEIIIKEAIDPTRFSFDYDDQQFAYQEAQSLLLKAIATLQRTDGNNDPLYVGRTDKLYNGDRSKWLKLAYGLLAINLNHYSNKASYRPDSVIALVDKSFASNNDDALFQYPATSTDLADYNFLGRSRNNHTLYARRGHREPVERFAVRRRGRSATEPDAGARFTQRDLHRTGRECVRASAPSRCRSSPATSGGTRAATVSGSSGGTSSTTRPRSP
jgi:hypothetical protein